MTGSSYKQYYLLKSGRKIGLDSVFVFDFTFDCESEGKIIFRDPKIDRVGFLDSGGRPIIPAVYNYALPFRNGMALACHSARRKCRDHGGDTTRCEHLGWDGGVTVLINEGNEILADSLSIDRSNLNWYSKTTISPQDDSSVYIRIKGRNGISYWFIDYDKEFRNWYDSTFLPALQEPGQAREWLFNELTYWSELDGWTSLDKGAFFEKFPDALAPGRFAPGKLKEVSISQESLNEMIFDKGIYRKYRDACGAHNKDRYPLYDVMLTYRKKRKHPPAVKHARGEGERLYEIDYQEHFEFLKTENGYRLLSVSLKR